MYAARKNLSTILIATDIGGQLGTTRDIANYPGYELITGPDLVQTLFTQAQQYGIDRAHRRARGGRAHRRSHQGPRAGIAARGLRAHPDHRQRRAEAAPAGPRRERARRARRLLLLHLRRTAVRGPRRRCRRRRQLGAGGGPGAGRHRAQGPPRRHRGAHRRRDPRGQGQRQPWHRSVQPHHELKEIHGARQGGRRHGDRLRHGRRAATSQSTESSSRSASSPTPASRSTCVDTNESGEIIVDSRCHTGVRGVFAAGDCTDVHDKQIVISVGEGATAALAAFEYLVAQI